MNKKVILFDVDGVLVHSEMFSDHYQKVYSIPREEMSPFYSGVFQDCLVGKADLKEVVKPWLVKWKWKGNVESFLKEWFDFENKVDARMIDLVEGLRKNSISCYLVTNQEKYRTEYVRDVMMFGKIFDGIFSSAEIGCKKPQPEFYDAVISKLGVSKTDVLYVDDTVSNVENAKHFGLEAYLFVGFEKFYKEVETCIKNNS